MFWFILWNFPFNFLWHRQCTNKDINQSVPMEILLQHVTSLNGDAYGEKRKKQAYFQKPAGVLSLSLKCSSLSLCMFESWLLCIRIIPVLWCLNILVVQHYHLTYDRLLDSIQYLTYTSKLPLYCCNDSSHLKTRRGIKWL